MYNGIVHSENLSDGKLSGKMNITDTDLIFEASNGQKFTIPLFQLQIEQGGTSQRKIFLSSTTHQNFTFSTSDLAILNNPFFAQNKSANNKANEIKFNFKKAKAKIIIAGIFFVVSLVLFVVNRNWFVKKIANSLPLAQEQQAGKLFLEQIKLTQKLDQQSPAAKELTQKINLLTKPLAYGIPFNVYISDSDEINAFALPGGYMVFNKGLLQNANSWEEVLGVAGHEIAHVTQKHHMRGVVSKVGMFTIVSLLLGDGSALTDLLFGAGANLEQLSYSRDFESESDQKGFEYLINAKINPIGMKTFFEKLEKEQAKIGKDIPDFLSTHPSSKNRATEIQQLIDKSNNNTYLQIGDYKTFKTKIK